MIYQPEIKPNQPQNDIEVRHVATCRLPTEWGEFQMHGFEEVISGQDHVALTMGDVNHGEPVLTRVHSECLTGDALFSQRCDCGPQLQAAMQAIQAQGRGCIVYLRQEGRGIGLINKIRAYQLQDQGMDTVEANVALGLPVDARNFVLARNILRFLHITDITLMTNNPQKVETLQDAGINVVAREPLIVGLNRENEAYLQTKHDKLGHML
ncbi:MULTISPECIES: GTP cyclohydrolase II [Vitreoscilla]|uniref:GTP cyclohydrolase-2 n=1 Tax=Vitreoscilla stercoraria TaxID=61 RepID=A0ABY4E870_VITST|nr:MULTISPECIES: GTP cyclohydrolase II [Vitreoscilla]AUZ04782.1 GTP cyclohydrolase 2 [Vitreoscilla sp. C1]UOO91543.1 GTP cyclohydrolase II [Vitreoscilla stercoraria]